MGTRGAIGFRNSGRDYITYNHFDSYPGYLGNGLLGELAETNIPHLLHIASNLILVSDDEGSPKPTDIQVRECKEYVNLTVASRDEYSWYCLLRGTQGTLKPYIAKGLRYMIDSSTFIYDSLWCEYAYIVNLDKNQFEFYKGLQLRLDPTNRYKVDEPHEVPLLPNEKGNDNEEDADSAAIRRRYYPCRLLAAYDLKEICNAKDVPAMIARIVADMEQRSEKDSKYNNGDNV